MDSWLAWQNEPGKQIHQAIKYNILNPHFKSTNSQSTRIYKLV
ncbi:DUF3226 domain-containing protein [Trichormus sp. NMC-1]